MASFRTALLICVITLAFVDQGQSCFWGGETIKLGVKEKLHISEDRCVHTPRVSVKDFFDFGPSFSE